MFKHALAASAVLAMLLATPSVHGQFFTDTIADPIVVQIGDGSVVVSGTGYTVQLRHYLRDVVGQIVPQSTATFASGGSATDRLVLSASATSEGNLTNSADRNFVVLGGYDAPNQTASVLTAGTNAPRTLGFGAVNSLGLTGAANTAFVNPQASTYNATNIRSAVSTSGPGGDAWMGGNSGTGTNGGVKYANTNTQLAATPTNVRSVDIYNSQLFTSSASGAFVGVNSVGIGLSTTSGQTITNMIATGVGSSPYEYVMYNDPNGNQSNLPFGVNRVYVADDRVGVAGGIQRWSWNGATWVLDYTMGFLEGGNSVGMRGLAGYLDPVSGNAVLFTTRFDGTILYQVTDTAANAPFLTLATADTNTVFRGVALAAVPEPATLAVAGASLMVIGLGFYRYRRRKALESII